MARSARGVQVVEQHFLDWLMELHRYLCLVLLVSMCWYDTAAAGPDDLEQARKLFDQGQIREAADRLDAILAITPTSEQAWVLRASLHRAENEPDRARLAISRALELAPNDIEVLNEYALQLLTDNDVAGALASFQRGLTAQPNNIDALAGRARCRHLQGEFDSAIADYSACLKANSAGHEVWELRGDSYFELGKWQEARADYTESVRRFSENAKVWVSRGNVLLQLQELRGAVGDFSVAIELAPNDATAWSWRAAAYSRLESWEYVHRDAGRAISLDANHMDGWGLRGMANSQLGRPQEALSDFEKALSLQKTPVILVERARVHSSLGSWQSAQRDLLEATQLDNTNHSAWNELGVSHLRLGQWKEAKAAYSTAIQLDGQIPLYWRNRAALAAELGELESAAADYALCVASLNADLEDHREAILVADRRRDPKGVAEIAEQVEKRFPTVAGSAQREALATIRLLAGSSDEKLARSAEELAQLPEDDRSSYTTLIGGLVQLWRKQIDAAIVTLSNLPATAPIEERALAAYALVVALQRSGQSEVDKSRNEAAQALLDQITRPAADSQTGVRMVWQDRFLVEWVKGHAQASQR